MFTGKPHEKIMIFMGKSMGKTGEDFQLRMIPLVKMIPLGLG
jgi:hypothetical protein